MSLIQKVNPVGIDYMIDRLQAKLYSYLTNKANWTNYESYPRAYVNEKNGSTIPEIYVGNNEYKECLMDDKFNATSFFLVGDKTTFVNGNNHLIDVSIIFQADIAKLYSYVPHRPDEEMHKDIYNAIKQLAILDFLKGKSTGIKNVYTDLTIDKQYEDRIKQDDMSNLHVVKYDFSMYYNYSNC